MVQRQTWTADLWVHPSGVSWYGNPQKIETGFQDIADIYFTCFDFFGTYYIVKDIHLEHISENENQSSRRGICSKYPLRTPPQNIHLEQVF